MRSKDELAKEINELFEKIEFWDDCRPTSLIYIDKIKSAVSELLTQYDTLLADYQKAHGEPIVLSSAEERLRNIIKRQSDAIDGMNDYAKSLQEKIERIKKIVNE